jgi:hypothetical protein
MMPSSGSTESEGGSGFRRWGPVAAIVVVVAVIVALVVLGGGDDEDDDEAASTGTTAAGAAGNVEAVSFSEAQEQGLEATFPEACDLDTGRVAIPLYYAPECFANVEDNGGATAPGVT